jgi:regulator of protease activity HflC (stomatin/prohibitin superfamily)
VPFCSIYRTALNLSLAKTGNGRPGVTDCRVTSAGACYAFGMNLTDIVALIVLLVLLSGLRIAREYQRALVFRLGRYTGLRGPGLFWLIPLGIENQVRIDLRVVTAPIEQQETITRDSVTVKVNAVLW